MKLRTLVSVVSIVLAGKAAIAQVDVCKALLAQGAFDTSQQETRASTYNRYHSVYCSSAASDYGSAKSTGVSLGIPIDGVLASFGFNANASSYNTWHSELCSSQESLYNSEFWNSASAKTASAKLLDTFKACVASFSEGLLQYVPSPADDSRLFSWTMVYRPDGGGGSVNVQPSPSANVSCVNTRGQAIGRTPFPVTSAGATLSCTRKDCGPALLVLNADRTPHPSTLPIPRQPPP
jgi:hypothetical protein